jgi:hypothetical protein
MSYWAPTDLIALIGTQVVTNIFDDVRAGYPNLAQIAVVQAASDAEVDAAIARVYPGPFPISQNFQSWKASTGYVPGNAVIPLATQNGFAFRVTGIGGVSGPTEPTWTAQVASTTTDGTLTWICIRLVPEMVFMASLLWGKCLSYERHPEYTRTFGDRARKEARAYTDRLVAARAYLTDALSLGLPGNVGGFVQASGPRMTLDANGQSSTGDF